MKKNLFFLQFLFTTLAFSQTTITKAFNDPIIGDVISNNQVTGTVDNSATGSGATFSNPSVTMGAAITNTYSAPTTAEITTFPGSTIKNNDGAGTTYFYKTSATQLEITGLINTDATLNFSADNAIALKYPTSFGNTFSDNARGTFTSTVASGLFKGTISSNADASGTLIIGTKTFTNVLRIKTVQNFNLHQSTDTMYLFPIGTITNTMYLYFDNIRKFPLLTYTEGNISVPLLSINQNSSGAQAQNFVFMGTDESSVKTSLKIYPNPTQDFIFVEGKHQFVFAEIYSADSRLIKTVEIRKNAIDVSDLSVGNYLLKLSTKDSVSETIFFIKK